MNVRLTYLGLKVVAGMGIAIVIFMMERDLRD